jgi:hypothetical protein
MLDSLGGQAARLEETRRPQPFVQPHPVHGLYSDTQTFCLR